MKNGHPNSCSYPQRFLFLSPWPHLGSFPAGSQVDLAQFAAFPPACFCQLPGELLRLD